MFHHPSCPMTWVSPWVSHYGHCLDQCWPVAGWVCDLDCWLFFAQQVEVGGVREWGEQGHTSLIIRSPTAPSSQAAPVASGIWAVSVISSEASACFWAMTMPFIKSVQSLHILLFTFSVILKIQTKERTILGTHNQVPILGLEIFAISCIKHFALSLILFRTVWFWRERERFCCWLLYSLKPSLFFRVEKW